MNFFLSCISNDDVNEQLKQQQKSSFNRFLYFTNYTLSSVENHHYLIQFSASKSIKQCSKTFPSEYELDYHITMSHLNQSILCSECNTRFRSNRALKNHQQRFHLTYSQDNLPDYSYISSYLVIAFSTKQFPLIAKTACEQKRLPLGYLSSKLFQCNYCLLSFPCSRTLNYHILNKHEQYEYKICRNILYDIVLQVERNLTINDDDDIESIGLLLSRHASNFGLVDKKLAKDFRRIKQEQNDFIFSSCQHENRTCANLCLKDLSSYNKLIQNYPYKITTLPKGNPFAQGSLLSKILNKPTVNTPSISKDNNITSNQKRSSLKRVKSSLSDDLSKSPSKKRLLSSGEQQIKTNETKLNPGERISSNLISPKKFVHKTKPTYVRSLSSMSSSSSISTRKSSKNSKQQSTTSLKRSISPTIALAVERSAEKRRRQRQLRKTNNSLTSSSNNKTNDGTEQQENDDDDDNNNNIVSLKFDHTKQQRRNKQRQESNSSVEYVQILNHDQQSIPSLNNIENLKEKSKMNDDEIILCNSPPSSRRSISSSNRNHSEKSVNGIGIHKSSNHQSSDYDENVRVRCKICGDILQGRSRFSKHVLTMHSHLVKSNISTMKQQSTTIVR